nr:GH36 C-terminal domain-containing protein [uncultured Flavobacterium sp.]
MLYLCFIYAFVPSNYGLVRLEGLDPSKKYKVKEINIMPQGKNTFEESGNVFSGDFLMKIGLKVSSYRQENSVVFEITDVEQKE